MEKHPLLLNFKHRGLHFPNLGLWMDPHEPQAGDEIVFVSHAHSDHVAAHREVVLSRPTARLMAARMPGERKERVLEFGVTTPMNSGRQDYAITLLPAGHIFGSAMALLEAEGQSLLYTGDFKLRRSLSAETCEPRRADILVMETTFGRPHYKFPPSEAVLTAVIKFCREALDNEETPVLLGYSLGKSQEILCGLGEAGLPLMLHSTVFRLTEIYQQFGQCFPAYEKYEASRARGKVLLCPPNVTNSAMLRKLGPVRSAILTGWAVDPNCRFRYQCDAAFPLSDHADFPELIQFVQQVQPKQVYTLHGFAADFAATLRQLGYEAQAVSEDEQLALSLGDAPGRRRIAAPSQGTPASEPKDESLSNGALFADFVATCAAINATPSKLQKVAILAGYFSQLRGEDAAWAATWFSGRAFPATQNRVLQAGWAVLRDALCSVASASEEDFHQVYLKHSDLGETAAELLADRTVSSRPGLRYISEALDELGAARGPGAKVPVVARVMRACGPLEAKFFVKIITGDLRIGLKEGLVEDAVAQAYSVTGQEVRTANLLVGDIGETARLASEQRLGIAQMQPFRPIKFMLASPESSAEAIWQRLVGASSSASIAHSEAVSESEATAQSAPAVWLEDKYDGVRCQLHKVGPRVELYSRDLKNITRTFQELADTAGKLPQDLVLDGEIVAMRGGTVLPFSELQKRLGRRDGDLFMREEVPIRFVAFDMLWRDGVDMLKEPLRERRKQLQEIATGGVVLLASVATAHSPEDIDAHFAKARRRGNEGLMIKDPESAYSPGRRGLAWLKLKKAYATLDCVVVGAEFGHGKRNKVLSDYTFAVRDEVSGELKTIGKAYSGLTDVEIAGLTEHFLKTATAQHGRFFEVPSEVVLEIAFDRLQSSQRHSSGLAMRFPRIVRIRNDKSLDEIDTVQTARRLAEALAEEAAAAQVATARI